ncbi:MAG TPA: DUF2892 domain-containing protein [Thermoanaerobaculaceae bacterium]|nr:DUF2892 domain-containing protein [Thermoanaerobaculaceae bacterium]
MKTNMGGADRLVRLSLGVVIVGAGLYFRSWWGAIGAIPILTAAIGWCPAYQPFGISTCRTPR